MRTFPTDRQRLRLRRCPATTRIAGALLAVGLALPASGCGAPDPVPRSDLRDDGPWRIEWATYVGGSEFEEIREPVPLPDGSLLFGARTKSRDMPVVAGAYQPEAGGGAGDSWLGRLSPDGTRLLAATYFGGSGMERPPYGIAVEPASGDVVFTSGSDSKDLPTSGRSYRSARSGKIGGYVARISGDLTALRWCSYTGGLWPRGGLGLAPEGSVVVAGRTPESVAVLELAPDGATGVRTAIFGGNARGVALSLRFAANGDRVVTGISETRDFPTTPGAAQRGPGHPRDAVAARLTRSGRLVYSTLVGGRGEDGGEHPHALLADGSVVMAGVTESPDFPVTPGAHQVEPGSEVDGWVARLVPDGSRLAFSTRLGGAGPEHLLGPLVAVDGTVWVAGMTASRDFPTTPDALQSGYAGGDGDGVVVQLAADGSRILYASYIGGSDFELVRGLAFAPDGGIFLVGKTLSDDFPVTQGAFQTRRAGGDDGFVVKLAPHAAEASRR